MCAAFCIPLNFLGTDTAFETPFDTFAMSSAHRRTPARRSPSPLRPHARLVLARSRTRGSLASSALPLLLSRFATLSGAEFLVLASFVASACAFVPQPALMSRSKIGMSKQLETPKVAMSLELSSLEQVTQSLAGVVAVDGGTGDGCGSNTRHTGLQSVNSH